MAINTGIDWCDSTWDPCLGCTKASPGCNNCWALKDCWRLAHNPLVRSSRACIDVVKKEGGCLEWTGEMRLVPSLLDEPKIWRKRRVIFVGSKCDVFHEDRPREDIYRVLDAAQDAPQHVYLWLTKRPKRMARMFNDWMTREAYYTGQGNGRLPLNWMPMVTAEDQERADERIPELLSIPAHHYGVSIEPMLSEVKLSQPWVDYLAGWKTEAECCGKGMRRYGQCCGDPEPIQVQTPSLSWVICGGESRRGAHPTNPQWVRSLRDQCVQARVPFFFKQWGEWVSVSMVEGRGLHYQFPDGRSVRRVGKKAAGHLIDGKEWHQRPAILTEG